MESKIILRSKYIRPLTVALIAIVFGTLILVMGLMDLARLDRTLIGFMENRGLDIIKTVEKLSQENLNYLYLTLKREAPGTDTFVPIREDSFSSPESLIRSLFKLARKIDVKWQAKTLTQQELEIIASEENIWLITVLDRGGKIVFKNREFVKSNETDLNEKGNPSSEEGDFVNQLLKKFGKPKELGYIALRRKDGTGTIIVALDNEGLRYWSTRIAVNKTIEEVGWGHGLEYLMVIDTSDKLLGIAGEIPLNITTSGIISKNILEGKTKLLSRKVTFNEKKILEIFSPIRLDKKIVGYARLGLERTGADKVLKENKIRMFLFTLLIFIIGILSMWFFYQSQNKHLKRMEEMDNKLRRAERLSALGQLAAGVAHEIRNPLNAISIASQRLQREYAPREDEAKQHEFGKITGIIREEIKRLNGIIEEFITFFKSRKLELHNCSISLILQKLVELIEAEAQSRGISILKEWDETPLMVPMDRDKMKQALLNILKNAMESVDGTGTITISVTKIDEKASVKIKDTGSGLTADEIDHIFNPEYTTKEKGLGLGLPLAHEIIRGHRGDIHVESCVDSGTTFEILLPLNE